MARGGRSSSSSSRSSYGSRGSSSSRSSSPQPQQRSSMPQQNTQSSVPMQQQSGGMMSGIGSTIVTGMAFGAGSEIAHQAVRGMMGGSGHGSGHNNVSEVQNNDHQQNNNVQEKQNPCMSYNMKFVECLKTSGNDISDCQNFFNDLKTCEKGGYN